METEPAKMPCFEELGVMTGFLTEASSRRQALHLISHPPGDESLFALDRDNWTPLESSEGLFDPTWVSYSRLYLSSDVLSVFVSKSKQSETINGDARTSAAPHLPKLLSRVTGFRSDDEMACDGLPPLKAAKGGGVWVPNVVAFNPKSSKKVRGVAVSLTPNSITARLAARRLMHERIALPDRDMQFLGLDLNRLFWNLCMPKSTASSKGRAGIKGVTITGFSMTLKNGEAGKELVHGFEVWGESPHLQQELAHLLQYMGLKPNTDFEGQLKKFSNRSDVTSISMRLKADGPSGVAATTVNVRVLRSGLIQVPISRNALEFGHLNQITGLFMRLAKPIPLSYPAFIPGSSKYRKGIAYSQDLK